MPKPSDEHSETPDTDQLTIDNAASDRPPIFGWMKGTMTIPDGVDLTEPACPEWPDLIEEKMARIERMLRDAADDENGRK